MVWFVKIPITVMARLNILPKAILQHECRIFWLADHPLSKVVNNSTALFDCLHSAPSADSFYRFPFIGSLPNPLSQPQILASRLAHRRRVSHVMREPARGPEPSISYHHSSIQRPVGVLSLFSARDCRRLSVTLYFGTLAAAEEVRSRLVTHVSGLYRSQITGRWGRWRESNLRPPSPVSGSV